MVKNPPANAGDKGSSPSPGRSHMPRSNKARALQLLSPCFHRGYVLEDQKNGRTSLQPCWDQVFLARLTGSPLPHTKGDAQISLKPPTGLETHCLSSAIGTWIDVQDITQPVKWAGGQGEKKAVSQQVTHTLLHGQEGLCNDTAVLGPRCSPPGTT